MQPSFNYRGKDVENAHFRIKYKLKARIVDEASNNNKTRLYPMKAKKNVIISAPTVPHRQNIIMENSG
jgi:hypothetical protein